VVLPLLGPSTMRDALALTVDMLADPWTYVDPVHVRNAGHAVRAVDGRAGLLGASNLLEDAALDRYLFVRDFFMQHRRNKVHGDDATVAGAPDWSAEDDSGPSHARAGVTARNP
jgi:phospholipid-binding lipoprotein MlaA